MRDVKAFSKHGSGIKLRSYQQQVCAQILKSIEENLGMTFVVIFPRQSGKNEVQAILEAYLLAKNYKKNAEIVKVAPTLIPQIRVSMDRLKRVLETNIITQGRWSSEAGYIYRLGSARIIFLSGNPSSNVVGATANLLLECDEAQSVMATKWDKDFAPMAASANTTTVFWGTSWTTKTLLAREMRAAKIQEGLDGMKRVFVLSADEISKEVKEYGKHVASQVARLGREHPLIKTQYYSEEIDAQTGMFTYTRQALMQGSHPPQERPMQGGRYAVLLDIAGEEEGNIDGNVADVSQTENKTRDATALTVVQVDTTTLSDPLLCAPRYKVVNRYKWSGVKHSTLYGKIKALAEMWRASYIVIDATGIGAGLASFLEKAFPRKVIPVTFNSKNKSEIGWRFLAIIETGRYKEYDIYAEPEQETKTQGKYRWEMSDTDQNQEQFWMEVRHCQSTVMDGPGKIMKWGVPANARDQASGELVHDDLIVSAALCAMLDMREWGVGESDLIKAIDPMEGMSDVF